MDDIKYLKKRLYEIYDNKIDIKYEIDDNMVEFEVYNGNYPYNRFYSGIINIKAFDSYFGEILKRICDKINKQIGGDIV